MIHARTDTLHYTSDFMTRHDRKTNKWEIPILDHEIAVTDAAGTNASAISTICETAVLRPHGTNLLAVIPQESL